LDTPSGRLLFQPPRYKALKTIVSGKITKRKIIAALQTSVNGFIEGPNGELDWAMAEDEETWRDVDEMLKSVDTFILGRGMYSAYEQYWLALLAKPTGDEE
jgi:hypothetical protein